MSGRAACRAASVTPVLCAPCLACQPAQPGASCKPLHRPAPHSPVLTPDTAAAPRPSHGAPANIPADLYAPGGLADSVLLDLAVLLVQQTSLGLVAHPWGLTDQQLLDEDQPEPMYPSEWRACWNGKLLQRSGTSMPSGCVHGSSHMAHVPQCVTTRQRGVVTVTMAVV